MSTDTRWPSDWLRGTLEMCALAAVAADPAHGYAVATRLAEQGLGTIKGGTLYPLLARLENEGLLASAWQAGDGGPGRKVFRITAAGRAELARRADLWRDFSRVTMRVLDPGAGIPADV